MSELCMLYNFAPKYREGIFKAIDEHWDTEWFFGNNSTDIKGLDLNILKKATLLKNKKVFGHWYWQKGAVSLASKDYKTFFLLGEPYCLSSWVIALRIKLFSKSKKLYFWTHGWYGKEGKLTKVIKKAFFKLADGVFLYGRYAKELMIKEGFDESRLFVIHNSLQYDKQFEIRRNIVRNDDLYESHFGNNNPVIIFIGRLTKVKNLELLVKAIAELKTSSTPINVVFVGDGSEAEALKEMSKQLGVEDNCWFYGACYDEEKNAELIYNADICVSPGNVGLTAMHSMVFGTPVITHNDFRWQMPEFEAIKPGMTGDFFEKNDVDSLASTIKNWLNTVDREEVRKACYNEIDTQWTPDFQMSVLKKHLIVD